MKDQGPLNLVASDLFFGLGAIMLVVVAAVSLNLRAVMERVVTSRTPGPEATLRAVKGIDPGAPVLLADAAGLRRIVGGREELIALDRLWQDPRLEGWLQDDPLLIVAAAGQEAAFLTFSRAASLRPEPIATLRLPGDCRILRQTAEGILCQP
jgi:hypothetical protein